MATSAFKSTTKRTPILQSSSIAEDSSSSSRSSAQRRSRSLSRFSRPLRLGEDFDDVPAPRGRFVNTVRGSGFPEISLDDLAIEFFDASSSNSNNDRGRSASRKDDVNPRKGRGSSASLRRGRSVSRQSSRVSGVGGGGGGGRESLGNSHTGRREDLESNSRRKRSVSVVRYQISDSESDLDHSQNLSGYSKPRNNQMPVSRVQTPSNHRRVLRRSISQKDLTFRDDYSSQSSALTDDEGRDLHSYRNGIERTIRTVYAQKAEHPIADDVNGGLYEVMRKELRHAVEEIKMELEQTRSSKRASDFVGDHHLKPKNTDVLKAVSSIRRNTTELDKSDNRRQDVLAKIVLEEQRGRELSMIAKDMLPGKKDDAEKKPSRTRKRSNDRNRMSERLDEEAEKYIEDFISNIEDTDISSLDGERSETSSTFGGISKTESYQTPPISKSNSVEIDGVALPWLQWETTNDASPLSCNKSPVMQSCNLWSVVQEAIPIADLISSHSTSSHGSWSPGVHYGIVNTVDSSSKSQESGIYPNQFSSGGAKRLSYDVEEYLNRQSDDEFLYERLKQQQRIHSGGLMLCNRMFF
ncbi:hypothetical protein HS088_TW18G00886 [Tripterygium wilfordii]|uniref:Uncharacterized protein n=1 Tax=Tripterygium wilfordii TaxID=458696 RepID=A0A7J7CE35_TRIWF|nr:uncharacterized protein LOC119983520 [Tripterygium wilfordii]KAF5732195.1 hypothetical protein HS088_TW18G00886 [Tripterygium wilfordii]